MNEKFILRTEREEGGFLYIVSIGPYGFPITNTDIQYATIFNDRESAEDAQGMIAGQFEIVPV